MNSGDVAVGLIVHHDFYTVVIHIALVGFGPSRKLSVVSRSALFLSVDKIAIGLVHKKAMQLALLVFDLSSFLIKFGVVVMRNNRT